MKRAILGLLVLWAALLFAPMAMAAPDATVSATAPTQYEDGNIIPVTDTLGYTLYCSNTLGGPYLYSFDVPLLVSGTTVDVSVCVQGAPGTYYFVATATSSVYASESGFSNEATRTWTAADLGKTPLAPTLFTVQ